jgi:Enoyl-CoA hydratase/isomerase
MAARKLNVSGGLTLDNRSGRLPTVTTDANSGPTALAGHATAAVADGVATITFGHPKGNSMPGALLKLLASQITTAGANPDVNVIVLRSSGTGAFCAGASFDELA